MTLAGFYHSARAALQAVTPDRVAVKVKTHQSRAVWYATIHAREAKTLPFTDHTATYEAVDPWGARP